MSIAIFNYGKGGGGAKLSAKAYTTVGSLPASDTEGALAVITSTAINDVYAAQDMPSTPTSGDIAVWLGSNARVEIDLGKNILLPPRACFQYNGTTWVYKEAYVYHIAVWEDVTLYVYLDGSMLLIDSYSGVNYGGNNYGAVAITLEATFIKYLCTGTVDREQRYGWSTTLVDLTDIDTIIMDYDVAGSISDLKLMVSLTRTNSYVAGIDGSKTVGSHTVSLDVSALSGSYYIGLYGGRSAVGSANVDQISINSFLLVRS